MTLPYYVHKTLRRGLTALLENLETEEEYDPDVHIDIELRLGGRRVRFVAQPRDVANTTHPCVAPVASVTGCIVKPRDRCACGYHGWVLAFLFVCPSEDPAQEKQRTEWECRGCGARVATAFEPGPGDVANTTHPDPE